MFWIIAGILVFLWLMGLVLSYTMEENPPTAGGHPYRTADRVMEGDAPHVTDLSPARWQGKQSGSDSGILS